MPLFICLLFVILLSGCQFRKNAPPNALFDQESDWLAVPVPNEYPRPAGPEWISYSGTTKTETAKTVQPEQKPPAPVKPPTKPNVQNKPNQARKERQPSFPAVTNQTSRRQLSIAELTKKYPAQFLLQSSSGEKKVALTFDDGPDDKFTPQVLNVLKKYNVRATFFILGSRAEKYPYLVKRMVNEGHVIGNHSYNHAYLPKLSYDKFQFQVKKTDDIIARLTGYSPKFLRPPYGEISESQLQWTASRHMLVVNWNVDSQDWRQINAQQVIMNVMKDVKPGSVILQHSGGGEGQDLSGTVQALPVIIEQIRAKGITLVTLPDLLKQPKQK
jgi:peptidoglycan/xylan/chitin deacetylase (PgdA/CDA1 family)